MTVTLGEDAVLEYLPDETIPFAGSDFSQQTRVHMLSGAVLFAMDLLTPGRTARGECFAFTRYYSQRLQGRALARVPGKLGWQCS